MSKNISLVRVNPLFKTSVRRRETFSALSCGTVISRSRYSLHLSETKHLLKFVKIRIMICQVKGCKYVKFTNTY